MQNKCLDYLRRQSYLYKLSAFWLRSKCKVKVTWSLKIYCFPFGSDIVIKTHLQSIRLCHFLQGGGDLCDRPSLLPRTAKRFQNETFLGKRLLLVEHFFSICDLL